MSFMNFMSSGLLTLHESSKEWSETMEHAKRMILIHRKLKCLLCISATNGIMWCTVLLKQSFQTMLIYNTDNLWPRGAAQKRWCEIIPDELDEKEKSRFCIFKHGAKHEFCLFHKYKGLRMRPQQSNWCSRDEAFRKGLYERELQNMVSAPTHI